MAGLSVVFLWLFVFFFNDTATTEIYPLSLHDALPISPPSRSTCRTTASASFSIPREARRSEEHTSELQSRLHIVSRLLLEKKNVREHFRPDEYLIKTYATRGGGKECQ